MPGISWQQRFSTWHFLSMLLVCRWMTGLSSCRSIVANGMRRLQESDGLGMCLPSIQRAGCLRLKRENRIGMQKLRNMAPGYHHVPWDIMGPCHHRMSVSYFCEPEGPFNGCTTHGRATAGCTREANINQCRRD